MSPDESPAAHSGTQCEHPRFCRRYAKRLLQRLWTTTMPQLTRRNSALRQAAMSIGAISRALSSQGSSYVVARNFGNIANLLQSPHYQNAIVYYCQALRLQGQADFQTASIQEAVLLSILFVAFEALRGNRHSALQHVKFGFVLLQELLTSEDSDHRIWNLAPDPRQLITEILDLYNHLDVQSRTVLSGHVKSSRSPAYELIKGLKARGHTIETYNMQIQRYTDPGEGRKAMPEVFSNAEDAYCWWQICQRRIAKLGPLLLTVIDDFKVEEINDEAGIDQLLEMMQNQPELLAYCEKVRVRVRVRVRVSCINEGSVELQKNEKTQVCRRAVRKED